MGWRRAPEAEPDPELAPRARISVRDLPGRRRDRWRRLEVQRGPEVESPPSLELSGRAWRLLSSLRRHRESTLLYLKALLWGFPLHVGLPLQEAVRGICCLRASAWLGMCQPTLRVWG